jgi:hypothetical protein
MRWMVYVGERGWPSADVMILTAEIEVLIGDRLAGNLGVVNNAWVREAEVRRRGGYSKRPQWLSAGFYKAKACPWEGSGTETYS